MFIGAVGEVTAFSDNILRISPNFNGTFLSNG